MLGKIVMMAVFIGPFAVLGIAMIRLLTDPYVHRYPYKKPADRDIVQFDREELIARMKKEHTK